MFNLLSKVLSAFFDPFLIALLLAVGSILFWRRRRVAFWLLAGSLFLLLILSVPPVALALTRSLEGQFPDAEIARIPPAPALVVLGGTIHMPSPEHRLSGLIEPSDRLLLAYRLYRAGRAPLVLCSGGNNPVSGSSPIQSEAAVMCQLLEEWGVPVAAVEVENGSINTRENAVQSYRLLAPRGVTSIILVTSALHMPRAVAAFRKAGFAVTAAPADFHTGWGNPILFERWLPSANNIGQCEKALHEWLGLWVYRWRGWA